MLEQHSRASLHHLNKTFLYLCDIILECSLFKKFSTKERYLLHGEINHHQKSIKCVVYYSTPVYFISKQKRYNLKTGFICDYLSQVVCLSVCLSVCLPSFVSLSFFLPFNHSLSLALPHSLCLSLSWLVKISNLSHMLIIWRFNKFWPF